MLQLNNVKVVCTIVYQEKIIWGAKITYQLNLDQKPFTGKLKDHTKILHVFKINDYGNVYFTREHFTTIGKDISEYVWSIAKQTLPYKQKFVDIIIDSYDFSKAVVSIVLDKNDSLESSDEGKNDHSSEQNIDNQHDEDYHDESYHDENSDNSDSHDEDNNEFDTIDTIDSEDDEHFVVVTPMDDLESPT